VAPCSAYLHRKDVWGCAGLGCMGGGVHKALNN
jgi:hypothetical protein